MAACNCVHLCSCDSARRRNRTWSESIRSCRDSRGTSEKVGWLYVFQHSWHDYSSLCNWLMLVLCTWRFAHCTWAQPSLYNEEVHNVRSPHSSFQITRLFSALNVKDIYIPRVPKKLHTHSVLIAIFPGEPGLAGCPLSSSPFIPKLRMLLGQV